MYASSSFFCPQSRFSTYQLSGNSTSSFRTQAGAYRRLQLTHQEQEPVIPVSDESLRLRAPGPLRLLQGRFECRSHVRWQNAHLHAGRDLVDAPFLPVEHRHRIPALVLQHAVDDRPRHVGLPPFELSDILRHASPILFDADRRRDERAGDRRVPPNRFQPARVGHVITPARPKWEPGVAVDCAGTSGHSFSPYLERDRVDAGESRLRADAGALGHRGLIVHADVGN